MIYTHTKMDKAALIRNILTTLSENLHKNYKTNITVNELLVYRENAKSTQCTPRKHTKYGIKVFGQTMQQTINLCKVKYTLVNCYIANIKLM